MTRFLTLDHAYDAAFAALPHANHDEWFEKAVFGTSDFLDVALRAAGHDEAKTLVANFFENTNSLLLNGQAFHPDVVISREAGRFGGHLLRNWFPEAKLVCTCSHRVSDIELAGFDCVFTSFPWFIEHVRSLGVRCEYLPLAFGKPVLERLRKACAYCGGEGYVDDPMEGRGAPVGATEPCPKCTDVNRDIPVCFIGGLGMRTWKSGTETMAAIAEAVPEFQWWGYIQGSLSDFPPALQKAYRGEAWGADMYRTLMRTKVLVNRHGEIAARGGRLFGNNTRQFEASGCGCMLLTDDAGELVGKMDKYPDAAGIELCATYKDAAEAIDSIRHYLSPTGAAIGGSSAGRSREYVLANHCYENRVSKFLEIVESL